MSSIDEVVELLKKIPLPKRTDYLNNLSGEIGLSPDEKRVAFLKAAGLSDKEISKEGATLKRESQDNALMNYVNALSSRNPLENISRMSQITQLRRQGTDLHQAFIEVFGIDVYKEQIGD